MALVLLPESCVIQTQRTSLCPEGGGRDSSGVWDGHVHSAIFRYIHIGSQQGPTVCYVPAWMGGESGGEWTHVHVWLSPFSVRLKLS